MNRRFLTILLAVAFACQSCLAGFAFCSEGGCCHEESVTVHDDHDDHDDHYHGEVHDHLSIVHTAVPHSCECTDRTIEAADAITSKRDESATTSPVPILFAHLQQRPASSSGVVHRTGQLRPPPDAALINQLAVVRATRLLL